MKNHIYIAALILINWISISAIKAQDLNNHYGYQLNWYNINPAFTGETDGVEAMFNYRAQWNGIEGSPINSMFGLHTGIQNNMGIGGKVIMDKRGLLSNLTYEFNYSYKVVLKALTATASCYSTAAS